MFFTCLFTITLSAPISRYISLPYSCTVMSFGVNKVETRQFMIYKVCAPKLYPSPKKIEINETRNMKRKLMSCARAPPKQQGAGWGGCRGASNWREIRLFSSQEMLLAWGVSVLRCFYSFKFGVSGRIRGSDIYITLLSGFLAEHLWERTKQTVMWDQV